MGDVRDIPIKRAASTAADVAANARVYKTREDALRTDLTVQRDTHVEPLSRDKGNNWQVWLCDSA